MNPRALRWPVSASQLFGAKPTPKRCGRVGVEAALAEESAAHLGVGRAERSAEELGGGLVRGEQPGAVAVVGRLAAVFVVQLEADAAREPFDRLGEGDVVHPLQEREDVAALAAAEAVVEADLRAHVEARAALVVERAEALERADAGGLQSSRGRRRCPRCWCGPSPRRCRLCRIRPAMVTSYVR